MPVSVSPPNRASSGLESYDVARWTDWTPQVERVHFGGVLNSLLQVAPKNAKGENETEVHDTPRHVLLLFTRGASLLQARVGDAPVKQRMEPWDGIFLPAGTPSYWLSSPRVAHGVFHLHIEPAFFELSREHVKGRHAPAPMVGLRDPVIFGLARMAFEQFGVETLTPRLVSDACATMLAARLISLNMYRRPPRAPTGGLAPRQLARATEHLMSRLADDCALADLAVIAGLSPHHFCRAFKRSTGLSPNAWLTERRIERAQELIAKNPRMGLTEIALCVGYQSHTSFGQAFRRAMGLTPSQWRRERLQ